MVIPSNRSILYARVVAKSTLTTTELGVKEPSEQIRWRKSPRDIAYPLSTRAK